MLGGSHTCGVKQNGLVVCRGRYVFASIAEPEGIFRSVSGGFNHTCGIKEDGSVACWGGNDEGEASPPEGKFDSVSAGGDHTCGIRLDGSVACWGANAYGQSNAPKGKFDSVSAGGPVHLRDKARWLRGLLGKRFLWPRNGTTREVHLGQRWRVSRLWG